MTIDSPYLLAARAFMSRGQLTADGVFVGRRQEENRLRGALCSGSNVQSVWISGPRQIGKSSLAARIPFLQQTGGQRVDLSLGGTPWSGLDGLAAQIFEQLTEDQSPRTFSALYKHVEKLCKPTLVVLDEFDQVAAQLKQDDQAGLRKMADKLAHFGWVFISRAQPTRLCQDFGDDNSRLVSICHQIRLGFLSPTDLDKLAARARELTQDSELTGLGLWIYHRIGGYPVAAQAVLARVLLEAEDHGAMPTLEQLGQEAMEDRLFNDVREDLAKLWLDLAPSIQRYIEHNGEHILLDTETRAEMNSMNLLWPATPMIPAIPQWLRRVVPRSHRELTGTSSELGVVGWAEKLLKGLRVCNERAGELVASDPLFPAEELHFYLLIRPARSMAELGGLVALLRRGVIEPAQRALESRQLVQQLRQFLCGLGCQLISGLYEMTQRTLQTPFVDDYVWRSMPCWETLALRQPPKREEDFAPLQEQVLARCAHNVAELADALGTE